ncbi:hypothetical protein BC826DRAFT_1059956 [Russula brevipes]|nr:hypothetical protein BC826DRAFT_1059956 [Russula brevipes]
MPRRRKLSAAEDVAARVRARWAALEALERASTSASGAAPPADRISATAPSGRTRARANSHHVPERQQQQYSAEQPPPPPGPESEREKENAMPVPMQVDGGHEKPLPPRPAALALPHINPAAREPARTPATTPAHPPVAATMMMMAPTAADARSDDKNGSAGAGESTPASEATLRTTPTSLTCFEMTESQAPVLQRRPTRALTPPQVRRRPSITDELEEAKEEATLAMLRSKRTDGLLRCPRGGCDELLGGVRALTFHLHIHSVGAGAYVCMRCGGAFESAREFTRHSCARHRARERLRSLVRAWTCLSPTGQSFGKEKQPQQPQQQQQPLLQPHKRKDDNSYY